MAKKIKQPTVEQIAELNALLRETEVLARELNDPIGIMLSSLLFYGLRQILLLNDIVENIVLALAKSPLGVGAIVMAFPLVYYFYYRIYQRISEGLLLLYPNGFGYDNVRHPAYEMQYEMGDEETIDAFIKSLHQLIIAQKSNKNEVKYVSRLISILLPLILELNFSRGSITLNAFTVDIGLTLFGPSIHIKTGTPRLPGFILDTAEAHQGLTVSKFFYKTWSNYNISKQLKLHQGRLKTLSCLSNVLDWKLVKESKDSKELAMFMLKLSVNTSVSILDHKGNTVQVSKENYIIELHRSLLDAKLPVYVVDESRIYVGFSQLNDKRCHAIKTKLLERLMAIEKLERKSKGALQNLNKLSAVINVSEKWEYYLDLSSHDEYEIYYYLNTENLPTSSFDSYIITLQQMVAKNYIVVDDNIITVSHVAEVIDSCVFSSLEHKQLETNKVEQKIVSVKKIPAEVFVKQEKDSEQSKSSKKDKKADEKEDNKNVNQCKTIYPEKIYFGRNVCFFRAKSEESKSANFAYPMQVPWLPQGRAYGSLDPNVIDKVKAYLSPRQLLAPLEKGIVIGSNKSHKTKAGAEGIQKTNEPYQNIYGEIFRKSSFKLKYTNNIRIFSHKADEVVINNQRFIHYRFDGPAFGH